MENFIKKLRIRISEEKSTSLENIKKWRKVGAKDAELNSIGENIAFSMVEDIITELECESQKQPNELQNCNIPNVSIVK